MKISEIMTKKVYTIYPDSSVKEAARLMFKHGFTGLPVINKKNQLVGIITESDLIKQKAKIDLPLYIQFLDSILYLENPSKKIEEEIRKILGTKVADLMTKKVITVTPDTEVSDLATLMLDKHINPVPVIKGKKLVGIVSRADLIKLLEGKGH